MPQKRSLKKIEKQQIIRDREVKKEKRRIEKTIGSMEIPDLNSEDLMEQLKKMRAITPTGLANHYNIKVSVAKKLLGELFKNNMLNLVSRSHNLKIYQLRN